MNEPLHPHSNTHHHHHHHNNHHHHYHNHHESNNHISSTHPPFLKIIVAGKGTTIASKHVIEKVMQLSNKKRPYVAYFGTACKDRESQYKALAVPYEDVGCHVVKVNLWNNNFDSSSSMMNHSVEKKDGDNESIRAMTSEIIHRADVILLSGGSKGIAMKKWQEYGIDEMFIHAAYRSHNPPIFVGGSAGALCLGHTGLKLLPMAFVPHLDTLSSHKVAPPHRILAKRPHITCIGLDENAAWLIHGYETCALSSSSSSTTQHHHHHHGIDEYDDDLTTTTMSSSSTSSSSSSSNCYHIYYQNGRIESSSLPFNEMIPLTSLGISIGPTS